MDPILTAGESTRGGKGRERRAWAEKVKEREEGREGDGKSASFVANCWIMAKVLYAASAWWGFTYASDRQRIEAFVGRAKMWTLLYRSTASIVAS